MRKRILTLLGIILILMLGLIYRLFSLQVLQNDQMLAKVSYQRMLSVPINNLRGNIFDRNMIPLTDNDEKTNLIIIPSLIDNPEYAGNVIASYGGVDYDSVMKNLSLKRPFQYSMDYDKGNFIKNKLSKGIVVAKSSSRYGSSTIARHVVGYVNAENVGQSGIEKGYDAYLRRKGRQFVGLLTDAFKRPIYNLGYRAVETFWEDEQNNVKLTLDYHFQNIIEQEFDKYSYNGAAVLLDVRNGDIIAMVSRPNFEQNDIKKYLSSDNKELINKALYPYNIGSVFKIVVAEAAIESGAVTDKDVFFCPGYAMVDGQMVKCSSYNAGGHGAINFENAFATSCNTAFVEIGLRVGYNKIIETARKFGIGQSVGMDIHGFTEDPGFLKYKTYVSNRETANVSIGQGDILVTPLQAANLIAIVANDGVKRDINLVDSIVDEQGNEVKKVRSDGYQQVIPMENARKLQKMMELVIKSGTGTKANIDELGGAAGKTSSAETGIYSGDSQIIHAWFGGYFPEKNPRYALVILIENGQKGSQTAAPAFAEIASQIIRMGY